MTNAPIIAFDFEDQPVRTVEHRGAPWFVLNDLCRILDIGNPRMVAARLDEDERSAVSLTDGRSQQREMTIVNESGLYATILRSRGAATPGTPAHRFRRWVTSEVLPSLRKDGVYGADRRINNVIATQNQVLKLLEKLQVTRTPASRRVIHRMLDDACRQLGIDTPLLEDIGRDAPLVPDIAQDFWNGLDILRASGVQFDHSRKSDLLAVNLLELKEHFRKAGLRIKLDTPMRKALQQSQNPAFVAIKSVNSVSGKTVSCWVFQVAE